MFSSKLAIVFAAVLFYFFMATQGSFIKPNNVPRIGRSNEAEMPFDNDHMMGYVIKTNSKNIPRMGRRNYDSENRFDIPKFYQMPSENEAYESNGGEEQGPTQDQIQNYYKLLNNMK